MKKIIPISIFAILLSCTDGDRMDIKNDVTQNEINVIEELMSSSFTDFNLKLKYHLQVTSTNTKIHLTNFTSEIISSQFNANISSTASLIRESNLIQLGLNSNETPFEDLNFDELNTFSQSQKEYLNPFLKRIYSSDETEDVRVNIDDFNNSILQSSLSRVEKIELIYLSSSLKGLANFVDNGGVDILYSTLSSSLLNNQNFRTNGCSVSTRTIFGGAVVGFATGAVAGAYGGATAGTFTVPVLGTAVGAVGFVSGATTALFGDLLLSCFRSTTNVATCSNLDRFGMSKPIACYGDFGPGGSKLGLY